MTMVIPFAPNRLSLRRQSTRAETDAGLPPAGAAILFFTGVRYERQPEPVLDPVPRKRRAATAGKRLGRTALAGQTV